jgi:hypothetical protein
MAKHRHFISMLFICAIFGSDTVQGDVIGRLALITWVCYVTPGNCIPHVFKRDVEPSAESKRE